MHYLNLTSVGEDAHETLRQLMHAVHGFNSPRGDGERIAVAFPAMLEAVVDEYGKVLQMPRSGAQLRLFGSAHLLEEFAGSGLPQRMLRMGMALKGAVQEVPPHVGAVRFVRDRGFERKHPNGAYERRRQRRAQEQGRTAPALTRAPRVASSFSFALTSKSTSTVFHLDVRKELTNKEASLRGVTAYGLCGPHTALPLF